MCKISELISVLEDMKEQEGDIQVVQYWGHLDVVEYNIEYHPQLKLNVGRIGRQQKDRLHDYQGDIPEGSKLVVLI